FKTIRNMLDDVIRNNITDCVISEDVEIKLTDGERFHFILSGTTYWVYVKGLEKSQNNENNEDWKETQTEHISGVLSCKQLDNQDLALITKSVIFIYTIVENSLMLRYFWNNKKWEGVVNKFDIKILQEILDNEFKGSLSSIPSPNF